MFKATEQEIKRKVSKPGVNRNNGMLGKVLSLLRLCFPSNSSAMHDEIELNLAGLNIVMKRETNPNTPYEVSVYVPRAEIRKKCPHGTECPPEGCPDCTVEILLNSITIVHAPRHPLAGETQKPPEIPNRYLNSPENKLQ